LRYLALLFRLFAAFIVLAGCQLSNLATPSVVPTLYILPSQTPQPTATLTPVPPMPTATHLPSPTATPYPRVNVEAIENFKSRYLGDERTILVYLPGDYASRPADRRYKVLYANDGQDMPQIALDQVLTRLYAQNKMEEIIVVAITTDDRRLQQYGTGRDTGEFGWGGSAYYYMEFLAREVVPYIDSHYATQTGAKNTALMGWSLGGLSAFCTAFKYPKIFGTVGVFSGSLWWRTA
jgi:enterochelin esterase-like enzyme